MGKRSESSTKKNPKRKSLAAVKEQPKPKAQKPVKAKASAAAAKKDKKDPNLPKKPATAFFVFLEDFRKTYKRDHPNVKGVAVIGKAGGDKWKGMTDEEKAPFLTKAAKRKADYDKDLEEYNNKKKKGGKKEEEEEEDEHSPDESEEKSKPDDDEGADEDESDEDDE